jgi:hypothetical protein
LHTDAARHALHHLLLRLLGEVGEVGEEIDPAVMKEVHDSADFVMDLGSAAGLNDALRAEFRDLAPRFGDSGVHELTNMFRMLTREGGDHPCLPPAEETPSGDVAALVHASPLLSAAGALAAWVEQRDGVPGQAGDEPGPTVESVETVVAGWPAAREQGLPRHAREQVFRLAAATGMVRAEGGRVVAGDGLEVWREGTPDELVRLGLDAFGAVVAGLVRLPEDPGIADEDVATVESLVEDLPFTLISMYEEADVPASLARMAAIDQMWRIGDLTDEAARPATPSVVPAEPTAPAPMAPDVLAAQLRPPGSGAGKPADDDQIELDLGIDSAADSDYRLPSDAELERLLGITDVDAEDRAELLDVAPWQALVLDRLAALGVLRRDGDRVELTRLGRPLLRLAFLMAGGHAPTVGELAAVDAATMLTWMFPWSSRAQVDGLLRWADAHGGAADAWLDMLAASAREHRRILFELLGVRPDDGLPLRPVPARVRARETPPPYSPLPSPEAESALREALAEAVHDPVVGAYAAEALRLRGQPSAAAPPPPARAVLLYDRLISVDLYAASRRLLGWDEEDLDWGEGEEGPADTADTAEFGDPGGGAKPDGGALLCAEFDRAAADWPGGARALIRQLAATTDAGPVGILKTIADSHPDPVVARAARTAATAPDSPTSHPRRRAKSASGGRKQSGRSSSKKRRRH